MSIRTIIEINHDQLRVLDDPALMKMLKQELQGSDTRLIQAGLIPGIRILGQRHHSETLNLEVK